MAGPMMRELAKWAFEGKIKAVVEREDHAEQTIDLGSWQTTVTFGTNRVHIPDERQCKSNDNVVFLITFRTSL